MFLRFFVVFLLSFVCIKSDDQQGLTVRIYSNLAEIIQPIDKLPLEFTTEDWYSIRSDSITLLGKNVNVTSQSITEKQNSLNGAEVYVRSPVAVDKSAVLFVKAILVDENRNLVKIQDQSVSAQEVLYFTVRREDIFYLNQPSDSKFYVDFTYTATNSKVYVSYLRTNIKWQTQYQLNLHHDKNDLIVMANIRNDGKSPVSIDKAELFSGDTNLRSQSQQYSYNAAMVAPRAAYANMKVVDYSMPTVESSKELGGVHVFAIDKPFVIDGQTNYLLPMFQPQVKVQRYDSISKTFSQGSNSGKAQRSYRLTSDQYLSQGNCIIRESNHIVGETVLPNLAAKDKHEFSVGQDAEVIYAENVTLISSTSFQEAVTQGVVGAQQRIQYTYQIDVQVNNFKTRSIKVEYKQLFYSFKLTLVSSTNDICAQDGSSIKCKLALNADDEQVYSYTVELVD